MVMASCVFRLFFVQSGGRSQVATSQKIKFLAIQIEFLEFWNKLGIFWHIFGFFNENLRIFISKIEFCKIWKWVSLKNQDFELLEVSSFCSSTQKKPGKEGPATFSQTRKAQGALSHTQAKAISPRSRLWRFFQIRHFCTYKTKKQLSSRFSKTQIAKISKNSVFAQKLSYKPIERLGF